MSHDMIAARAWAMDIRYRLEAGIPVDDAERDACRRVLRTAAHIALIKGIACLLACVPLLCLLWLLP